MAELDGFLADTHEVGVGILDDFDTLSSFLTPVLNKLVGLVLRVDHQTEPSGLLDDDTVLGTGVIFGETAEIPALDSHGHAHEVSHADIFSVFKS